MKKRLFIGILPMLMALSACGGASPNATAKEEGTFLEDTLAHEEVFGSLDDPSSPIKSIRNLEPTDPSIPAIGVQFYNEYDEKEALEYVSIRYVAAVKIENLASASATWNRTIYNADGSVRFAADSVECQYRYQTIFDGENGSLSIDDYNSSHSTNYNYFFMYALRRIPALQVGGALCASFTFNDGLNTPTTTKVVATRLDIKENSVSAAFDAADFTAFTEEGKYFLKGTIGGGANARLSEDPTTRGSDTPVASFTADLNKDDNFVVAYSDYSDSEHPVFKLLAPAIYGETSLASFTQTNGRISVSTTNHYALYLTSDNKLTSDIEYNVVIKVTMFESGLNTLYVAGDFNNWSTTATKMTEIGSSMVYFASVRAKKGDNGFKFYNGEYEHSYGDRIINATADSQEFSFVYGEVNYYLVGIVRGETDWSTTSADHRLTRFGSSGVYMITTTLNEDDSIKVMRHNDNGYNEWFGGSEGTGDWGIETANTYKVYFGNGWTYINVETAVDFNLVGDFNSWTPSDSNKLTQTGRFTYEIKNIDIESGEGLKIKSSDGTWYGESSTEDGTLNVYPGEGVFDIYFNTNKDGGVYITCVDVTPPSEDPE